MAVRTILSRRDWVYVLSLLIPFVVYNLTLKVLIVLSTKKAELFVLDFSTPFKVIYPLTSDVFFLLGYVLLWIGLFSAVRRGPLRIGVLVLFHATAILVVIIGTCAYQYFQETGTMLDYGLIVLWLPRLDELVPYSALGVPLSAWVLLMVALLYTALGPWLLTRLVGGWRGWFASPLSGRHENVSFRAPLLACCLALVFGFLSSQIGFSWMNKGLALLPGGDPGEIAIDTPFLRAPFVNVAVTAAEEVQREKAADISAEQALENSSPASLLPTGSERRNVVLILLESTRAQSVTPYNEDLETTPFLDELAKNSLLAERAYTNFPYSTKANVAIHCGISPLPIQVIYGLLPEARPGGIPSRCFPELLKTQGYSTAYFLADREEFENFPDLVDNFGYDYLHAAPYDDAVQGIYKDEYLLAPSEEWLTEQKESGNPFLATYFTTSPHYPYPEWCQERYGSEYFAEDEELNRYLNCLRYQDFFLKSLFDQYKELGLYENTIFVILGDHGQGFGEHATKTHATVPYEEGMRIPLIIHDPKRFKEGARVKAPVSQLDILPTITELLGYEIEGGAYQGSSLLESLPEDRTLNFSCWGVNTCLASLKGSMKYIYYYGNQPEQLFDLSEDPLEEHNLASDRTNEVEERRTELLAWRSRIDAMYRGPQTD